MIGYPVLSWTLEWSLLLSSSPNFRRVTNRRARLCLQGKKITINIYILCSLAELVGKKSPCLLYMQVWDIRTKMQIFALTGHDNTVCSVFTRPTVRLLSCVVVVLSLQLFFQNLSYKQLVVLTLICDVAGPTSCNWIS